MYFEDIDKTSLPANGQYYFNVLVGCISIKEGYKVEWYGDYPEVWDLSAINNPVSIALHFFPDTEFKKEYYSHCVVEVSELGVAWYKTRETEKV